ncbi:MAG: hypothetical protein HS104_09665 [Polyangiaceae bacterium]|nr:hypothetical protein [Polyangiaceae bacterium]MCL4754354.1 hypothetical protein [Myxococcales bacterium]
MAKTKKNPKKTPLASGSARRRPRPHRWTAKQIQSALAEHAGWLDEDASRLLIALRYVLSEIPSERLQGAVLIAKTSLSIQRNAGALVGFT